MIEDGWREEPIAKAHRRAVFDCGQSALNDFLAKYARQAHESSASKTYVLVDAKNGQEIFGFYTLCPAQLSFSETPGNIRPKAAGKHPVGCFRLAKLAVSAALQGQGVGGRLLASAMRRCMLASTQVGGSFLLIDAKDEMAAGWYKLYGALSLPHEPLKLVLSYSGFESVFLQD